MRCSLRSRRRRPATASVVCALVGMALAVRPGAAQLPTTTITSIDPPGAAPGSTLDVTVAGPVIDEVDRLVFSHPGIRATVKRSKPDAFGSPERPVFGNFTVTIAKDVPPGRYEARAIGRHGHSNPRRFVIGRWKELRSDGGNRSRDKAMSIDVPVTVSGTAARNAVDYYRVELKQGQAITVECQAQAIDSAMVPNVAIWDADGNELARAMQLERDVVLLFRAPRPGTYLLSVHDEVYDGGANYFYRLSVHAQPYVVVTRPLATVPAQPAPWDVWGWNLPGAKPGRLEYHRQPLEHVTCSASTAGDAAASMARLPWPLVPQGESLTMATVPKAVVAFPFGVQRVLGLAEGPIAVEQADNDRPASAQKISIPVDLSGSFYPESDDDWFEFAATEGESWWLEVVSHRIGSDADPFFLIQEQVKSSDGKSTWRDIVQVDDPSDRSAGIRGSYSASSDDPTLLWRVPRTATYRLLVRDQFGSARRDPRNGYRLIIRKPQPDVRVVGVPEELKRANNNVVPACPLNVTPGGSCGLRLLIERREGFEGDVVIRAAGLPSHVTARPITIGPSDQVAYLVFKAARDAPAFTGPISVQAVFSSGGKEIVRDVIAAAVVTPTTNRTTTLPRLRATDAFWLTVRTTPALPVAVDVAPATVETSLGGKVELPVKVTRHDGFKETVTLIPHGFPSTIRPGNVAVKGTQADARFPFVVNNNRTRPGTYVIALRGDTKAKRALNPKAIERAEADQKRLEELVKKLTGELAAAEKSLAEAKQAVDKAKKMLDQAKQQAAKEKNEASKAAQAAAEAALKKAQEEFAKRDQQKKELTAKKDQAVKQKQAADKGVAAAKKKYGPRDMTFAVMTQPVMVKIDAAPFVIRLPEDVTTKVGQPVELEIKTERKYGFEDVVTVAVSLPRGTAGIPNSSARIEKGKPSGRAKIDVRKNAKPGDYMLVVKAAARFNNVPVTREQRVTLHVEAAEPEKATKK